jgi:membrane protease YdiL (CAAX protease family)
LKTRSKGIWRNPTLYVLIFMALCMALSLFGARVSRLPVLVGVLYFIIRKALDKTPWDQMGMDIRVVPGKLFKRGLSIWFLLLLPVTLGALSILLSHWLLPAWNTYIASGAQGTLSQGQILPVVAQLAVLALGEEIAWRGLFQRQLAKRMPPWAAIAVTSAVFACGHYFVADVQVVIFDLAFVFLNSVAYGIVFHKTGSVWVSWIAHLLANMFAVFWLLGA